MCGSALRGYHVSFNSGHQEDEYIVTTRETSHGPATHDDDSSCKHGDKGPERGKAGLRVLARANEESVRCGRGAPGVSYAIIGHAAGDFCKRTRAKKRAGRGVDIFRSPALR